MPSLTRRQPKPKPLAYGEGTIFQRKSDGRFLVKVHQNGKQVQIGSSMDPVEARKILDDYNEGLKAGLNPTGRDWLTVDWLEHWLTTKTPRYDRVGRLIRGVEPTTFEKYETQIRRHIAPYIGRLLARRLTDLDGPQCQRWHDQLFEAGLGVDVLNEALQRLSAAMELAVDHDLILRNPCRRVERPKRPDRKHVKPSELDLVRLIRAIRGEPLEALVWIAMGGGFRRGEVAALQWEDVSIFSNEHGVIRAHRRRNRLGKRAQQRLSLPSDLRRERLKSQDERNVDIGEVMVTILERHWQHQLAGRAAAGSAWKGAASDRPSGYLFTTPIGTPLEVDKISKYLTNVRERVGLDLERFHALRRVFTTLLNKAGVPDRVTMELAGHAELGMTHYYQDPLASQKRDAAQALDRVLRELIDVADKS